MHLRRLAIHALPGIEPGFSFEPPDTGINIVTGPNAIGKSSLARALKYLLANHSSDPPALSLEAEFESGDTRWQVSRNGNQIVWRRDGEVVSRPPLPGADQIGLFRLSVENLLDDSDANDKALAERLRRELHGNFDLGQPRIEITQRFAQHEAKRLAGARNESRRVEGEYAALQRREAELPGLERQIEKAVAAKARCEHLEQALRLAGAIDTRKEREAALGRFPPDMDRLQGDELEKLEEREKKSGNLRTDLRDRERDREAAKGDLQRTGLAQSTPATEDGQATRERLRQLGEQSIERRTAQAACAETDAALMAARAQFNSGGDPPRLDADAFQRADEIAQPLIAAQNRQRELKEQLALAGETPAAAELARQRDGVEALQTWLAGNAAESGQAQTPTKWPLIASFVASAAAAFAALAAYMQGALVAFAGALAALIASGAALFLQRGRRSTAPSSTDEAMRRFHETDLAPPPQWNAQSVRTHLRDEIEVRLNALTLQQTRAAHSEQIRLRIQETDAEIERLESRRDALAGEIGFDPRLPVVEFHRFIHLCAEWGKARTRHDEQTARLALLDRGIAEAASRVHDFLVPWRAADAPALEDPAGQPDIDLLRSAFNDLHQRGEDAKDARGEIRNCETAIQSLKQRIADIDDEVEKLFAQAKVEPRDRAALANRIEQLPQWKEARTALNTANTEEELVRVRLVEQPGVIALVDEGQRARLQADLETSTVEADEHTHLIQQQTEIKTKLNDAGKDRKLEQAAAEENRAKQALEDKRDEALLAVATRTLLDDVERAFEAEHEPAVLRRAREVFADVTARAFDLRLRGDGTFIAHDVEQEAARELAELSSGTRMQLLLALRLAWIETQEQGGEALPLFLDEALTTSDERRFAVMAQSLERLAGGSDGGRGRTGNAAGDMDDARGRSGKAAGDVDDDGNGSWLEDGTGARAADRIGGEVAAEYGVEAGAGPSRKQDRGRNRRRARAPDILSLSPPARARTVGAGHRNQTGGDRSGGGALSFAGIRTGGVSGRGTALGSRSERPERRELRKPPRRAAPPGPAPAGGRHPPVPPAPR